MKKNNPEFIFLFTFSQSKNLILVQSLIKKLLVLIENIIPFKQIQEKYNLILQILEKVLLQE